LFQAFHAREWISPAVVTYIIHQLVEEPANLKLLQNVDWYIMPVVNPDGKLFIIYAFFLIEKDKNIFWK
jgi:murein tripeptide amidase MpaA